MIARWPLNSEPKEKFDPHVWGALPVPVLRYHEETKALFHTNLGLSVTTCKRNPTCTLPCENRSKALRQPMAKQGTLGQNKVHQRKKALTEATDPNGKAFSPSSWG